MAQASRAPSLKFLFRIYQSPPKYFPTDTELSTQVHEPITKIRQNTDIKDSSVISARHGMFAQQTSKSALWWQWHWQWWSTYDINDDDDSFQARLGCVITPRNPPLTLVLTQCFTRQILPHILVSVFQRGECFFRHDECFSTWWMFFIRVNVFNHGQCFSSWWMLAQWEESNMDFFLSRQIQ